MESSFNSGDRSMTFYGQRQAVNTPSSLPKRKKTKFVLLGMSISWYCEAPVLFSFLNLSRHPFSRPNLKRCHDNCKICERAAGCVSLSCRENSTPHRSAAELSLPTWQNNLRFLITPVCLDKTRQPRIEIFIRISGIKPSKQLSVLPMIEANRHLFFS